MSVERTVKILRLLGSDVSNLQNRTGWTLGTCPLAPWQHDSGIDKNPSFGARRTGANPHVNCFSCGFGGTLVDLAHTIDHKNKTDPKIDLDRKALHELLNQIEETFELDLDYPDIEQLLFGKTQAPYVFPSWWLDSFPSYAQIAEAKTYLQEREVSAQIAKFLDLRSDTQQHRVCFPVRNFAHELMGLHGRAIYKETEPRYRMYTQKGHNNPLVWLGESWVDLSKPIVVVEGPFDVAAVLRVYPNVVSPLFANPSSEKLSRMADALEWVTLLDRGKAGDLGRNKISHVLSKDHVVEHLFMPEGRKDPGECSVEELKELFDKSSLLGGFPLTGLIA